METPQEPMRAFIRGDDAELVRTAEGRGVLLPRGIVTPAGAYRACAGRFGRQRKALFFAPEE